MHETFGTQGCVGDRGSISGGGVESTLGHGGRENANFVGSCVYGGEFSEVRVLHGRSRREEARYGMRASRLAKLVTQVLVQTHAAVLSVKGSRRIPEDVLDALQFDLTQDDSDSNAQVNQRRHSPLHIQLGLAAVGQSQTATVPACSNEVRVSHARVFGRPASTNGSVVATERDPVDSTIRDGTVYRPTLADRSETQSVEPPRQRRRLVLLPEPWGAPRARDVSGSDTESLHSDVRDGVSEFDGEVEHTEETPAPPPVSLNLRRLDVAEGLRSLDEADLEEIFERRAAVPRTAPKFLQGSFRSALRVAFEEEAAGRASGDEVRRTRAWKLFLLLPRMLLHKPPRGGLVPRQQLEERFAAFAVGRWAELFRASREADVQASAQKVRRRRREYTDDLSRRAQRAVSFVQMGELSAARQALEGLSWLLEHWPLWQPSPPPTEDLLHLANFWEEGSRNTSLSNVSSWTKNFSSSTSQRGGAAAAGPSGMTSGFGHVRRVCPVVGSGGCHL